MDSRGVKRGGCKDCSDCVNYNPKSKEKPLACVCGCPPGSHKRLDGKGTRDDGTASLASKLASVSLNAASSGAASTCLLCSNKVHFDVNTGDEFKYCEAHLANANLINSTNLTITQASSSQTLPIPQVPSVPVPVPVQTCGIEECSRPRHVDANGTVHECCGYTHAMELIRRKNIERKHTFSNGIASTT